MALMLQETILVTTAQHCKTVTLTHYFTQGYVPAPTQLLHERVSLSTCDNRNKFGGIWWYATEPLDPKKER